MAIDWTPIEEGDEFLRTDLEERLNAIRGHLDAIDPGDIEDESLGVEVVPDTVRSYSQSITKEAITFHNQYDSWPGYPRGSGSGLFCGDADKIPVHWAIPLKHPIQCPLPRNLLGKVDIHTCLIWTSS